MLLTLTGCNYVIAGTGPVTTSSIILPTESLGSSLEQSGDILTKMKEVTELDLFQSLYKAEIEDINNKGSSAYSIFSYATDLDMDGSDEQLSYFISALNSGSLGNITLDIWKNAGNSYKNIGPTSMLALNPKMEWTDILLTVCDSTTNGFCDISYVIVGSNSSILIEKLFTYTDSEYQETETRTQGDGSLEPVAEDEGTVHLSFASNRCRSSEDG